MKYLNFPGTQEKISSIGLGTWVFGGENWGGAKEEESRAAVEKAIDAGINFIDTAPFYGDGLSERIIGRVIKGQRDKVFLATKCGVIRSNGRISKSLAPESIAEEIDLSRTRLSVDVIDLYQCHWPDENTPVEKTMAALLKLQVRGVIRYIGVSNFGVELLKKALTVAPVKTLQVPYSLLMRDIEQDLLPYCREHQLGVITYGSMGGGVLSGKYSKRPQFGKRDARSMFYKYFEEEEFKKVLSVCDELQRYGRPLNQLALNWVRQQPGVITALAGCRTAGQAEDNAASAQWDLTADEMVRLSGCRF